MLMFIAIMLWINKWSFNYYACFIPKQVLHKHKNKFVSKTSIFFVVQQVVRLSSNVVMKDRFAQEFNGVAETDVHFHKVLAISADVWKFRIFSLSMVVNMFAKQSATQKHLLEVQFLSHWLLKNVSIQW